MTKINFITFLFLISTVSFLIVELFELLNIDKNGFFIREVFEFKLKISCLTTDGITELFIMFFCVFMMGLN